MNEEKILFELEEDFLNFDKLDNIFNKKLPKDIVKVIYNMIKPICDDCFNCCVVCRIYCYFNCLRESSGRDMCNEPELKRELYKYNNDIDGNNNDDETTSLLS